VVGEAIFTLSTQADGAGPELTMTGADKRRRNVVQVSIDRRGGGTRTTRGLDDQAGMGAVVRG